MRPSSKSRQSISLSLTVFPGILNHQLSVSGKQSLMLRSATASLLRMIFASIAKSRTTPARTTFRFCIGRSHLPSEMLYSKQRVRRDEDRTWKGVSQPRNHHHRKYLCTPFICISQYFTRLTGGYRVRHSSFSHWSSLTRSGFCSTSKTAQFHEWRSIVFSNRKVNKVPTQSGRIESISTWYSELE